MQRIRIGIYWKVLAVIYASMILSSLMMYLMYSGLAPLTELHPAVQEALVIDTRSLARQIAPLLDDPAQSLRETLQRLYPGEQPNLRLVDGQGREVASCMEQRLSAGKTLSRALVEKTLRDGFLFEVDYLRLVLTPVVSVPLTLPDQQTVILQRYYPMTKGLKTVLPRGVPEILSGIMLALIMLVCSRYITGPLRELNRVARKMAEGKFGEQVRIRSHDEVGQLACTFNQMSQRLAVLKKTRSDLFADISHELRSPLARILSDAEILIDRDIEKKEQQQHLRAICNEVEKLDRLIGDLSILAQFDQSQVRVALQPSSLKEVLQQAISLFMLQMEEKGITLKQYIDYELPPVLIDPTRIGQVISNIIMNAIRYTPPGGMIEAGLRRRDAVAEVWIRDTGEGIPEDRLPFVFERFYRVDRSRARATGGSGLGLAIARQFIEAHHGEIHAESTLGQGTRISFTVPIVTDSTGSAQQ